jgi:hypothetical protein
MNNRPTQYNSIRQYIESEFSQRQQQQSNQLDIDANGNVSVLINLMDHDDETVDFTLLTHQEITALRTSDPFTYFSIMVAQQGTSSYVDLDNLTEERQRATAPGQGDAGAGLVVFGSETMRLMIGMKTILFMGLRHFGAISGNEQRAVRACQI